MLQRIQRAYWLLLVALEPVVAEDVPLESLLLCFAEYAPSLPALCEERRVPFLYDFPLGFDLSHCSGPDTVVC